MQVIYHGHSFLEIEREEWSILIDPFITDNPRCEISLQEVLTKKISHIVLTHGHGDHVGDTITIAQHSGCKVVAIVELCDWLKNQWIEQSQLEKHNIWGTYKTDDWSVKFVQAIHSNSTIDGTYAGLAAGLIFDIEGKRIYDAGDTALFTDMKEFTNLDLAFLPIGDRFTMWSDDAVKACGLIKSKMVVPIHYNTWSQIKADDIEFARQVMLAQYAVPKVLRAWQYIVL